MDLRQLKYFVAIAENKNFTIAGLAVHVTQSTLSHQIKSLEEELGCQLFDRTSRAVRLTEHGAALLPHALRLLEGFEEALRSIRIKPVSLSGKINLGYISTVHLGVVDHLSRSLLNQFPELAIKLIEVEDDEMTDRILSNEIHFGIGYKPETEGISFEPLYNDEIVLAVGPNHPLGKRKRIRAANLHGQRIAVLTSSKTRNLVDSYFQASKVEPVIVAEFNRVTTLLFLASGTGVGSIIPKRAVEPFPHLTAVALGHPAPFVQLGLLAAKIENQSDAQKTVTAYARESAIISLNLRFPGLHRRTVEVKPRGVRSSDNSKM